MKIEWCIWCMTGDKMDPRDIKVLALKWGFSGWQLLLLSLLLSVFTTGCVSLLSRSSVTLTAPSQRSTSDLSVLKSFAWWGSEHLSLQMSGVLPRSVHSLGPVAGFCSSRLQTSLLLGGSHSPTFLMCVRPCDLPRPKQCKQTGCVTPGRASNTGWSKQGLSPWMNVMSWGPLLTVIERLWVRNKLSHSKSRAF